MIDDDFIDDSRYGALRGGKVIKVITETHRYSYLVTGNGYTPFINTFGRLVTNSEVIYTTNKMFAVFLLKSEKSDDITRLSGMTM